MRKLPISARALSVRICSVRSKSAFGSRYSCTTLYSKAARRPRFARWSIPVSWLVDSCIPIGGLLHYPSCGRLLQRHIQVINLAAAPLQRAKGLSAPDLGPPFGRRIGRHRPRRGWGCLLGPESYAPNLRPQGEVAAGSPEGYPHPSAGRTENAGHARGAATRRRCT
jgi:hypothetical protein